MSFEAWIIFALFWLVFVTTPGPNALNCISTGMTLGFRRSLICVAAILTQATASLILSAFGITALTALSYTTFCALGAGLGRAALGAVFNTWVRRVMSACFIIYGVLLGSTSAPGRA